MNLAARRPRLGFAAGWVTGWAAYSPAVLAAFGTPPRRIAGFIFIGTPGAELEERPRPDYGRGRFGLEPETERLQIRLT